MKIYLRDDDLHPEQMEVFYNAYSALSSEKILVNAAYVPFPIDNYRSSQYYDCLDDARESLMSIDNSINPEELILKAKDLLLESKSLDIKVELMLHGVCHKIFNINGDRYSEFSLLPLENLKNFTSFLNLYVSEFSRSPFFTPPSNNISIENLVYLEKIGFILAGKYLSKRKIKHWMAHLALHKNGFHSPAFPSIETLFKNDKLESFFFYHWKRKADICISTHYWVLNKEDALRRVFFDLLQQSISRGYTFSSVKRLYENN